MSVLLLGLAGDDLVLDLVVDALGQDAAGDELILRLAEAGLDPTSRLCRQSRRTVIREFEGMR